MIIDKTELQKLELFEDECYKTRDKIIQAEYDRMDEGRMLLSDFSGQPSFFETQYFSEFPHLLMLLGFDEYKMLKVGDVKTHETMKHYDPNHHLSQITYESLFRLRDSGGWKWLEGIREKGNNFHLSFINGYKAGKPKGQLLFSLTDLILIVKKNIENPPIDPFSIILSGKWTPSKQNEYKMYFAKNIKSLIQKISASEKSLNDLHPRQFEELIAAILQDKGMDIYLTPYTRDGGRDIIARGESILGEPCEIAVEVKRKKVTGLADVQRALYANRYFPSLLLATSGRFSAGVISESLKPENKYRLVLKDGIAINEWIRMYNGNDIKNGI